MYAEIPASSSSLGLSLQWTPLTSTEDVWHVTDVAANSPADLAGLLPYADYIIGSPEGALHGEPAFGEMVEHFMERPLRIYVYNQEYDVTRQVELTPSKSWGGNGALGCVLGYGALHRIPASLEEPPQGPGETLFDTEPTEVPINEKDGGSTIGPQYLVPADTPGITAARHQSGPPPPQGRPLGGAKKPRASHHASKAGDMDAYFAEGEAKSREQDYGSSSPKPGASGLAPPPKGPPRASSPLKNGDDDKVDRSDEAA